MNTEKQKKLLSPEEWEERLSKVKIPKQQMNELVMDYLIHQGFSEAAEQFQKESSLQISPDLILEIRNQIRLAIISGEIDSAISMITDLNPSLFISHPDLLFALQLQKLVTYIKENKISEALAYGQEVLAPTAQGNLNLLAELEKTLSLLAFTDITQSPLAEISTPMYRLKIASDINAAIFKAQGLAANPKLAKVLQVLQWSQKTVEKATSFPTVVLTEYKTS